ncbi:MAG: hypothetical protein ABSA72_12630 [Nitrososphaerales archaeon]|jgi:hypothetical protein
MRARNYARIFGVVLLLTSVWEVYNHYTGVWSPFLFRQSAFDGDTVIALVGIALACIMIIPSKTSWALAAIVSLVAGFKLVTKFLPSSHLNLYANLVVVPDVLWCTYLIFCAVLMARYSGRITGREVGSAASAPDWQLSAAVAPRSSEPRSVLDSGPRQVAVTSDESSV